MEDDFGPIDSLEEELKNIESEDIFSPFYRRKKLIRYGIRTLIALIIYLVFWENDWVRWSLWVYIPLNLLGLGAIFLGPYLAQRKLEKVRHKLKEAEGSGEEQSE